MQLVMLIKVCLNEVCSRVRVEKMCLTCFLLSPFLFMFALEYAIRRVQIN